MVRNPVLRLCICACAALHHIVHVDLNICGEVYQKFKLKTETESQKEKCSSLPYVY